MKLHQIAHALGGEVSGGQVLCPGPGHSAKDRSLAVRHKIIDEICGYYELGFEPPPAPPSDDYTPMTTALLINRSGEVFQFSSSSWGGPLRRRKSISRIPAPRASRPICMLGVRTVHDKFGTRQRPQFIVRSYVPREDFEERPIAPRAGLRSNAMATEWG